jgi:putative transposase
VLEPLELRRQHIIVYRRWLEGRGLANETIQKKLSAIASLCKFLAEVSSLSATSPLAFSGRMISAGIRPTRCGREAGFFPSCETYESFNGRFRDEFHNHTVFESLEDAQHKIEQWRQEYNRKATRVFDTPGIPEGI